MADIIVIGAGAAGMMAAYRAACSGARVVLLEKNEKVGKKIYITGKGRCNLTNACDTEELFDHVRHNAKFLYSAFYGFSNFMTMDFFREMGCPLKVERGNRVFPVSDHASDVIRALERQLEKTGVILHLGTEVKDIIYRDNKVEGVVLKNGKEEKAGAVIVATGGLSYPSTGSTGEGYAMALHGGHRIVPTRPSLVPFTIQEDYPKRLQGLSLKNVGLSLFLGEKGKAVYEGFGEMLFTHFGVSGPLVLSASSYFDGKWEDSMCYLELDLKPALTEEQLDKRLLRDFSANQNKLFKNALGGLFPTRLVPVMIALSGIEQDKPVHEITKEERKRFAFLIKHWRMEVTGTRGYEEAVITMGGVDVKEVNPSTMESRLVQGLYFAGEVLDLDALTGGFNLQIAWSTGYIAGENAAGGHI